MSRMMTDFDVAGFIEAEVESTGKATASGVQYTRVRFRFANWGAEMKGHQAGARKVGGPQAQRRLALNLLSALDDAFCRAAEEDFGV